MCVYAVIQLGWNSGNSNHQKTMSGVGFENRNDFHQQLIIPGCNRPVIPMTNQTYTTNTYNKSFYLIFLKNLFSPFLLNIILITNQLIFFLLQYQATIFHPNKCIMDTNFVTKIDSKWLTTESIPQMKQYR